jgi:hypothetical protein
MRSAQEASSPRKQSRWVSYSMTLDAYHAIQNSVLYHFCTMMDMSDMLNKHAKRSIFLEMTWPPPPNGFLYHAAPRSTASSTRSGRWR